MPNLDAAKKALRASKRKKIFNDRRRKVLRVEVRGVRELVAEGKGSDARAKLSSLYQAIDKAAKRGVIKKGAADRKKSRLAKLVNAK